MGIQVDYAMLLHELKQRLADRTKGTMFLKTNTDRSFAIAFQDGAITGVSSGLTVGNEAVERLRKVKSASYTFSSAPFNPPGSAPEPLHVSLLLGADPPQTAIAPSANQRADFGRRSLVVIEENLLEVLGPVAMFLLDDALKTLSDEHGDVVDPNKLLSTLAREIDDRKDAERFIQKTMSKLKELR